MTALLLSPNIEASFLAALFEALSIEVLTSEGFLPRIS